MHNIDGSVIECVYRWSWENVCVCPCMYERVCVHMCVLACTLPGYFMYTNVSCIKTISKYDIRLKYMLVIGHWWVSSSFALTEGFDCLPANLYWLVKAIQSVLSCLCKISHLNLWKKWPSIWWNDFSCHWVLLEPLNIESSKNARITLVLHFTLLFD